MTVTVCQSKVYYDTEFEAEIGAAHMGGRYGEPMHPYPCGNHWHITHTERDKRRGLGHKFIRCDSCSEIVRRARLFKHKCRKVDV